MRLLLEREADTEGNPARVWTPLLCAADDGYESIVKLLLGRGADKTKKVNGETALEIARRKGYSKIVKLLEG